jgi:hypothetical protein
MPRPKKTATHKTAPKAKRGRPAKVVVKSVAKTKAKALPKQKQNQGKMLEQTFQSSLKAMKQFWPKQAKDLKAAAAQLKMKHKKALAKQKASNNARIVEQSKLEASNLKQQLQAAQAAFTTAKLAADKYNKLNREIAQFEKSWKADQKALKVIALEKAATVKDKPKAKRGRKAKAVEVAVVSAAPVKAKRGRKAKAVENVAESVAKAKRGRKPKAVLAPIVAAKAKKQGLKVAIKADKPAIRRGRKPNKVQAVAEVNLNAAQAFEQFDEATFAAESAFDIN